MTATLAAPIGVRVTMPADATPAQILSQAIRQFAGIVVMDAMLRPIALRVVRGGDEIYSDTGSLSEVLFRIIDWTYPGNPDHH